MKRDYKQLYEQLKEKIELEKRVLISQIEDKKLDQEINQLKSVIERIVDGIDIRSGSKGHSRRVRIYAKDITQKIGLSEKYIEKIGEAAFLHDIGKVHIIEIIAVPDIYPIRSVLHKAIERHPYMGAEILKGWDEEIVEYVRCHHERYDGKGYPYSLKGKDIPLGARIIAVADAFDVMTSERIEKMAVLKKPLSYDEAIRELIKKRKKQFDPYVVDIALYYNCLKIAL